MSYNNSVSCLKAYPNLEAIDFFFAQQMQADIQAKNELSSQDNKVFFHLMLALQQSLRQGHSCLPINKIANKTLWQDSEKNIKGFHFFSEAELNSLLANYAITINDNAPIVLEYQSLYIRRYWQFEVNIAKAINIRHQQAKQLQASLSPQQQQIAQNLLNKLFPSSTQNTQTNWQKVAIANAIGRKFTVITGGPGTGKTFTVTFLLALLQSIHNKSLNIQMVTPTGKAAQRLQQSVIAAKQALTAHNIEQAIIDAIPETASTLHRLLGFRPQKLQRKYNEQKRLPCDVLLIDEVSMIDLAMMSRLVNSLEDDCMLILIGDPKQLPAIETGNILAELCDENFPSYSQATLNHILAISSEQIQNKKNNNKTDYDYFSQLQHSHRFSGDIKQFADLTIQKNETQSILLLEKHQLDPISLNELEKSYQNQQRQLYFIQNTRFKTWLKSVCSLYFSKIAQADSLTQAFNQLAAFRILLDLRVGECGVVAVNKQIEKILQQTNSAIIPSGNYPGRPIMITENNYKLGLFNGDIGLLWKNELGQLSAYFEQSSDKFKKVTIGRLPQVETIYAMTIHKTQGSEFPHVAIVLSTKENNNLSGELLYTAITRAKEKLSIIADKQIWKQALSQESRRYSSLQKRLN